MIYLKQNSCLKRLPGHNWTWTASVSDSVCSHLVVLHTGEIKFYMICSFLVIFTDPLRLEGSLFSAELCDSLVLMPTKLVSLQSLSCGLRLPHSTDQVSCAILPVTAFAIKWSASAFTCNRTLFWVTESWLNFHHVKNLIKLRDQGLIVIVTVIMRRQRQCEGPWWVTAPSG